MHDRQDKLMSVIRAAFRLRVNPRWLKQEALAGRIPCLDCGGEVLVSLLAVEAALADRAARAPSSPGRLVTLTTVRGAE